MSSQRGCRYNFWLLANAGIRAGLVTRQEIDIIRPAGHRKSPYYCGHLTRLRWVLKERAHATR